MKKLFTILTLLLGFKAFAQQPDSTTVIQDVEKALSKPVKVDTSYWRRTIKLGFNLNQASFSSNWKGGGVNSIAYLAFISSTLDYEKGHLSFNNLLDLQFGSINNQSTGFFKNMDKIFFDSKIGYGISKSWNIYFAVNYLSQFYTGYLRRDTDNGDTTIYVSNFMAPGYLSESIGFEYKPNAWFFVRFGTGTLKQTFVTARAIDLRETKNYGVDVGKTIRNEMAFMLQSGLDKDVSKGINLKVRYIAFANYLMPKEVKENTNITFFDYIDHRIDASVTAKVTKYISTNLTATILYDYDQDRDKQISQSLGLGILLSF